MDVLMPQLGETVAEGKIVKWFKQAGDVVTPGENLFEIETDKTSMEVPSIATGTLTDIRFGVGDVAKVGAVVAIIAGAGEAAQTKPAEPSKTSQPPIIPAQQVRRTVLSTNAGIQSQAKKEPGLHFRGDERVNSSEPSQRDFSYPDMSPWREVRTPERNYGPAKLATGNYVTPLARRLASERGIDLTRVPGSGPHGRIVAADVETAKPITGEAAPSAIYLAADIDIGRLMAMRDEAKSARIHLSLDDFMVKIWAVALRRVAPASSTHIGLMTHVDGRRVTRIVRDAAAKTLTAIAAEVGGSIADAPRVDTGAASAVYVLSTSGIREFTVAVAPPFSSVLAVGQPRRVAVEAEDGGVKFVSQVSVTLSCDSRAIDSALGAELLASFSALVENPVAALV